MKEKCPSCNQDIDPTVCWCGDLRADHDRHWINHEFTPLGCDCKRAAPKEED